MGLGGWPTRPGRPVWGPATPGARVAASLPTAGGRPGRRAGRPDRTGTRDPRGPGCRAARARPSHHPPDAQPGRANTHPGPRGRQQGHADAATARSQDADWKRPQRMRGDPPPAPPPTVTAGLRGRGQRRRRADSAGGRGPVVGGLVQLRLSTFDPDVNEDRRVPSCGRLILGKNSSI